ncbi:MAG: Mur ligase family protein, partial [Primorskyibacter sp.]
MIPVQGVQGQQIGILGLGRSGMATAQAVAAGGGIPICWDDSDDGRARAQEAGFSVVDLGTPDGVAALDRLVVSPGIPHLYPAPHRVIAGAWAAGVPVDNDIGLFFQSLAVRDWDRFDVAPRVVAVTGSNGKSTTSALIAHILECTGRDVQLAGNIGRGVLDIDPPGDGGVVVVELSSYQTDLARALTPDVAVFINL